MKLDRFLFIVNACLAASYTYDDDAVAEESSGYTSMFIFVLIVIAIVVLYGYTDVV